MKVEKVIKNLAEMSKPMDEIALDLEKVAIRLNNLEVALRANSDEDKLVEHE
jgi:hypothetical protein